MTLPVGYFPCTQDPPKGENVARMIDEIVEQAEVCEQVGFDGFFFTEHHQQEDGYLPAPVLMAGMVGMRTRRIKVGTCVLLAPLYHPVRLAEDIAVVDQATKGRFITAAGIAYQPGDFAAFGVNPKQRVGRTEEVVEVLRKAWTGQPFSHPSKYATRRTSLLSTVTRFEDEHIGYLVFGSACSTSRITCHVRDVRCSGRVFAC
jgi:alkanesulfonate monooxygenase SsuD/methylene tetrahydromethanopterin reductase-like flavin-dependent oxidoreductase (luciferase family)